MSAFQPFLQYFAAGSDTASCQDYEEKEFVERFSEETQIIDIFTHCRRILGDGLEHKLLTNHRCLFSWCSNLERIRKMKV